MRHVAVWLFMLVTLVTGVKGEGKPNVIVILTDDFGYECVTANGGESYKTPNLDRLAATGVRFEQCHVQPLCTPTRNQLMTGRYNVRNYIGFGILRRAETTFAHLLKQGGYATCVVGKWQLGHEPDSPTHFGFDEACLWQHTRRPPRYANPGLEYNAQPKDFTKGEYGPTLVNDYALDFVTRHKDKPFFLYYPMLLTHDPFQPTPDSLEWDAKLCSEKEKANAKFFPDMVAYMDKMVGRLEARLTELGIRENTLIIYLGDNGTSTAITSRFKGTNYRGGKGSMTCRGTHVPLIANWPAFIKKPAVCNDLISSTDILPTLCEAAGVVLPKEIDGQSFLPQIKGEKGTPREWLYMWYNPMHGNQGTLSECIFDHRYKLYGDGRFFNLEKDPFETRALQAGTLSDDETAAAQRLRKGLAQFKDARPPAIEAESKVSKKVYADTLLTPNTQKKGKSPGQKKNGSSTQRKNKATL